ncbi:ATP-binding protein [Bdellovibrio sp. HCB2-146]|uniref:ATP-binding protein n=1 Tax=Bdellovibrio sp. HCB2-146 TaxID=3394362 RepID=UPI0039BC3C50
MKIQYSLFDTLLEPVFVLNADQKVIYCNETAAIICGLSIRKITRGMKFPELFTFSEPLEALDTLISITDPTPYKEVNFTTSQGGEGKVQLTLQPVFDSMGDKNWIVFVRDVTLEERLQKKYRAELEQKEDVIKDLEDAKVQLEDYSKNLEKMVADRTAELSRMNQTMTALLDSLGQGFFIFNSDGRVLDVTSKACENTIECRPQGQDIWNVLKLADNKIEGFKKWMQTLFMEMLPFEDLAPLGPVVYPHSEGRNISLEYHPLRSPEGAIEGVVVVATDITSLVAAQRQAENEKEHAKLIINMIKSKREIYRFIQDSQGFLNEIHTELAKTKGPYDTEALYRSLHTLKGGAAIYSVKELAESCHLAENLLTEYKETSSESVLKTFKEQCAKIETAYHAFLNETKEILGTSVLSAERQIEIAISKLNEIARRVRNLPGGGPVAQELLLELVMEPINRFFEPYQDVVAKIAEKEDKMLAPLRIQKNSIMVLPEAYSSFFGTLVHAFRNAVDHGIEKPDTRLAAGKPAEGQIEVLIEVAQKQDQPYLLIAIKDDGAGIDPQKIRARLQSKNIDASSETDEQVIQHIFDSQFSTRDQVTEISGRGVGMDAILNSAQALGGKVWVTSVVGQGSCLNIEIPYISELKKESTRNLHAA